jgi:hypothetical protein
MNTAHKNDIETIAQELLPDVARAKALARPLGHGLYQVETGWEVKALQTLPTLTTVNNAAELEGALESAAVYTILVRPETGLSLEDIRKIATRAARDKTIFVEGGV